MANILLWCICGAIAGWLTCRTIGEERWPGSLGDLVVGAGGAVMAGCLVPGMAGVGVLSSNDFNAPALAAALLGAILFLAIVGLTRRALTRRAA